MADNVINFKAAKKKAGYRQKDKRAAENRIRFGRRKTDKWRDRFETVKLKDHIDAHKLDGKSGLDEE